MWSSWIIQAQSIARWVLCRSRPLPYTWALTAHQLQIASFFEIVSTGDILIGYFSEGGNHIFSCIFFFLALYVFDYDHLRIIDGSSRVCPLQHPHGTTTFPNRMFIEVASIAIWNRNKVAMAIAISVWGVYPVLFLKCKLFFPPVGDRN